MNIALALIGVVLVASIVYAAVNGGRRMSSGRVQPAAVDHIATEPSAAADEAETMDRAALRMVGDKLPYITENHAAAGWTNADALDAADEKARALQAWADSLPEGAWRSALTKWIKISQNGYVAARAELRTHALRDERKKQSQGFDLERKQEERLIARMPPPPGDIRP